MDTDQLEEYVNEFVKIQESLSQLCPDLDRSNLQISVNELRTRVELC